MEKRMIIARTLGVTATGLALLLSSGCRTTPALRVAPAVTVWRADGGTDISHEIEFANSRLARSLRITDIARQRTEHGLLNPSVTAASMAGGTLKFEYRFSWFDGAGYEIGADTNSWKPVTLRKGESKTFPGVAPTAAVQEFKMMIRAR
jgi:uncharacterized protein YcfL